MDADYHDFYEDLYQSECYQHDFSHAYGRGNTKIYNYHVDMKTMKQTNRTTGTVRNIRRANWRQLVD